jgi:hypothetical protein
MFKIFPLVTVFGYVLLGLAQGPAHSTVIPAQTAVEIELLDHVSSESLHTGQAVRFRVLTPVVVNGTTVIAAGTPIEGEVRTGRSSGAWRRAGWFDLGLKPLLLADGTKVKLDFQHPKLRGVRAEKTGAVIADSIFLTYYFPLIPIALVESAKHGKPYEIRAGERYLVQVISSEPAVPVGTPAKEPQAATDAPKP